MPYDLRSRHAVLHRKDQNCRTQKIWRCLSSSQGSMVTELCWGWCLTATCFPRVRRASGLSYLQNTGEVVWPLKYPSEQVASNFRTRRPCGTGPVRETQWVLSVIMGTSLFSSSWHPSFPSLLNCLILPYPTNLRSSKAVIGEEYISGEITAPIPIGFISGFQILSSCFRKKPAKNLPGEGAGKA